MVTARVLTPSEWPKIDLPRHSLIRITLTWPISDEQRFKAVFADLLGDDGGGLLSVVPYRRSKAEHRRLQLIGKTPADEYSLWLSFDASGDWPSGPVPKELQLESDYMERLQRLGSFGPAKCRAEFDYRNGSNYFTVFPLPFELDAPGDFPWPIDEILGIRGVKHEPQSAARPAYRFTLDRTADESVWLLLTFELPIGPIEDAPEQALKTATEIAAEFVFKNRS